jgi:hypothetical protein
LGRWETVDEDDVGREAAWRAVARLDGDEWWCDDGDLGTGMRPGWLASWVAVKEADEGIDVEA